LGVVLLTVNVSAGVVLSVVQAFALLGGDDTIGLGFVLSATRRRLLVFHALGFFLRQ
jgi:hypothetical protein